MTMCKGEDHDTRRGRVGRRRDHSPENVWLSWRGCVNIKLKVMQEVCTQDGLLDRCNDENPPEGVIQPIVDGGTVHIGRNLGTVHHLQSEDAL